MSYPVFYVPAGDVLPVMFATFAGSTGASITMTGLAVTDIEIYKDGSTTQRASDAGYTLLDTDGIDFDGLTGIHGFSIDTGDNTDASFYTVGSWFTVVVSAVTVDSQTVSFIACAFRIMAAEAVAGKPKVDVDAWLGTAAATPTTAGVPEVDVTHVGGTAQTAGDLAALITTVDDFLDTEIAAIKAKTDNLPSDPADESALEALIDALPTATENADALLKRDMSAVTGESARSPLNALRAIRNKVAIAAGTMTVYKEDDSTSAWSAAVTTGSSDPLSSIDPS